MQFFHFTSTSGVVFVGGGNWRGGNNPALMSLMGPLLSNHRLPAPSTMFPTLPQITLQPTPYQMFPAMLPQLPHNDHAEGERMNECSTKIKKGSRVKKVQKKKVKTRKLMSWVVTHMKKGNELHCPKKAKHATATKVSLDSSSLSCEVGSQNSDIQVNAPSPKKKPHQYQIQTVAQIHAPPVPAKTVTANNKTDLKLKFQNRNEDDIISLDDGVELLSQSVSPIKKRNDKGCSKKEDTRVAVCNYSSSPNGKKESQNSSLQDTVASDPTEKSLQCAVSSASARDMSLSISPPISTRTRRGKRMNIPDDLSSKFESLAAAENALERTLTQAYKHAKYDDDMAFFRENPHILMPNGFTPMPPLDLDNLMDECYGSEWRE
ncbi:NAD kinase 1 [Frankliniella fusca]|uniref:NAD kinase 1 n=1 Tax=Frankliniella fusca TaxID=407009 RepID=A0AAE1HY48_9NEOP|nr:NAD kinase 1 [Frankliniella fusca]